MQSHEIEPILPSRYLIIGSTSITPDYFLTTGPSEMIQSVHTASYIQNIKYMLQQEGSIPFVCAHRDQLTVSMQIDMNKAIGIDAASSRFNRSHYPQDLFTRIGDRIFVRDDESYADLKALLDNSTVEIDEALGTGGRIVEGDTLLFYSSKQKGKDQARDEKIQKAVAGKTPVFLPSPRLVGLEDWFRALLDYHIDQMISPDILLPDGVRIIPIDERYLEALRANNVLPQIEGVQFLPIQSRISYSADLLNTPRNNDRMYLSPLLAVILSTAMKHGIEASGAIQAELANTLPQGVDQAFVEGRMQAITALQAFGDAGRMEAQQIFTDLGLRHLRILPKEMPTNEVQRAGLKCKTNFL